MQSQASLFFVCCVQKHSQVDTLWLAGIKKEKKSLEHLRTFLDPETTAKVFDGLGVGSHSGRGCGLHARLEGQKPLT